MPKPKKFTALSDYRIRQILDDATELKELAIIIAPEVAKGFAEIAEIKADLVGNYEKVIKFLHKIGLVGSDEELGQEVSHGNYEVSADALNVINAYYRAKNPENAKCDVEIVRYHDKGFPYFYDSFVNSSLLEAIRRDFAGLSVADEFSKTYIAEAGSGAHFYNISIKKEGGSSEPVIELFDSSPKLVRGGFDVAVNLVKWGTAEQIVAPVTVAKALEGTDFVFKNENYFHNLEPFQMDGPKYCGTYSLEHAYETEKQGVRDRIEYLRSVYKYDSLYGGMAELGISYEDAQKEFLQRQKGAKSTLGADLPKTFRGNASAMSHFSSFYSGSEERRDYLKSSEHKRKSGEVETMDIRRGRYLVDGKYSEMVQEKSMRQRLHLFEIVTSKEFQDFALMTAEELKDRPLSRNAQMTRDALEERVHLYSKEPVKEVTDPAKEDYRALFKENLIFPYSFKYDDENDQIEAVVKFIDAEHAKLDNFLELVSGNRFLKENCFYENNGVKRIDGNFGELKVHDSMRGVSEFKITIKNCSKFFEILKEERSKPSVEPEVKDGSVIASAGKDNSRQ